MSVIRSYFFCFLAIDNDIMRKMCTFTTSKATDIDENIANQNHATRTRTPKPGYLNLSNVYNMSGRVVSDIQTRAEGESLYIQYNTDANVVNNLKNDSSYEFIGEVILKINVV